MMKIIKNLSLLVVALMMSSFSFAGKLPVALDEKGIYFCTKDIDFTLSIPGTGSNPNNEGKDNIEAYYPLKNNKHNALNLRHCFMLFGTLQEKTKILHPENREKILHKEDEKLYLTGVKTYGFGTASNHGHAGSAQYYSKAGAAYVEVGLESRVVSCVPILRESELKSGEKIIYKWADVTNTMDEEVNKGYNAGTSNCCSVAHKAVESLVGFSSKLRSCFKIS